MRGVFVSHTGNFDGAAGGTQICSQEYFETIGAAGCSLTLKLLDLDRRLGVRIKKKIITSPFEFIAPPAQIAELTRSIAALDPDFVFLNQVNLAGLARTIRRCGANRPRIVLLSHGLESTDLLHFIRLQDELPMTGHARPTSSLALGNVLIQEARLRRHVDAALVLSPLDAALESWLGPHPTLWVPRLVKDDRLNWKPTGNRFGFIGTINHPPNFEGLVTAITGLEAETQNHGFRIRIISSSKQAAEWLQRRFKTIDYLGPLSEPEAKAEAATWNAFLHPIFCGARGCSTKLAQAIGWGIPIVTTELGHRGYTWQEGSLVIGNTPQDFARQCISLLEPSSAGQAREEVLRVMATSPGKETIVRRISDFLRCLCEPSPI
jgi:hypothetical protein